MTSNVLPLHFYTSQARWSQNSKFVSHLMYCEIDSLKRSYSESPLLWSSPRITVHIKFLRYRIFSSCVMHKKNYVHLTLQIRSKANDVIKIAWTLSGLNFSAIGILWRPLEAVLQPRHSDRVASPAKPRPLEAFKGQRWLKNWNHLKFRLFWSQY